MTAATLSVTAWRAHCVDWFGSNLSSQTSSSSGWPLAPPAALIALIAALPASASSGTLFEGPVSVAICMSLIGVPVSFAVVVVAPPVDFDDLLLEPHAAASTATS